MRIVLFCSGYEGIGIVGVLLLVYIFIYRERLKWFFFFLLFLFGVLFCFVGNVVRIVMLVVIGVWYFFELVFGVFYF